MGLHVNQKNCTISTVVFVQSEKHSMSFDFKAKILCISTEHRITFKEINIVILISSVHHRFQMGLDFLFITFIFHIFLSCMSSLSISISVISASTFSTHVFVGLPTGIPPSALLSTHFYTLSSFVYHVFIPTYTHMCVRDVLCK